MSGITSPSSANRGAAAVAAVIGAGGAGGAVGSSAGSFDVPVLGELPYTGAPLAIIMGIAAVCVIAGVSLRVVAFGMRRRDQADPSADATASPAG